MVEDWAIPLPVRIQIKRINPCTSQNELILVPGFVWVVRKDGKKRRDFRITRIEAQEATSFLILEYKRVNYLTLTSKRVNYLIYIYKRVNYHRERIARDLNLSLEVATLSS